jgi:4-hydroxybenzoate polyprenyltransferase
MLRIDHWPKNVLIAPGALFALSLTGSEDIFDFSRVNFMKIFIGTLAICLASSSNYLINEYLDRESDSFHPTKKLRGAVAGEIQSWKIVTLYFLLVMTVIFIVKPLGIQLVTTILIYLFLAILYNCKPFRVKDRIYIDVITESANNPLRLIFGWYLITTSYVPPLTLLLAFWALGIFLMSSKRLSEINQLQKQLSPVEISNYRRSFARYTFTSLSTFSSAAGLFTVLLLGIFSCKYKPEYLLFTIVVLAWITFYMSESHKEDSMVQAPEKLIRSWPNFIFALLIIVSYLVAQFLELQFLNELATETSLNPGDFWSSIRQDAS